VNSSTELRVEQIPASGTIPLSPANFFFLISATANVNVRFQGKGTEYGANGVTAGLTIGRVDPWSRCEIRGAAGTIVTFHYGDAVLREDVTDQRSQIATIAGIAQVQQAPFTQLLSNARTVVNNTNAITVAANLARRKLVIANPSDNSNPGLVYIQIAGAGAGIGIPLDSGMVWEEFITGAVNVRNDSGANVSVCVTELA
jgi:hypothetical protein